MAAKAPAVFRLKSGPGPTSNKRGDTMSFKKCPECPRVFEPTVTPYGRTKGRQVYCSKQCATRARFRRWYDRHKRKEPTGPLG